MENKKVDSASKIGNLDHTINIRSKTRMRLAKT